MIRPADDGIRPIGDHSSDDLNRPSDGVIRLVQAADRLMDHRVDDEIRSIDPIRPADGGTRPLGARDGVTLIELLVVLVILSLMAGLVGLAARNLDDDTPEGRRAAAVADARRRALETRRPVSVTLTEGDSARRLLALPDGSVRADAALGLDPLTGRPREAR